MQVRRFCNHDTVTVTPDTDIPDAARMMRSHHVGALVVVETAPEGNRPIGMVTDRDLVIEVLAQEVPMEELTVGDIMSTQPGTVLESDDLSDVLARMAELGVRRLPVTDDRGLVRGVVTLDDVLECMAELTERLRSLVGHELWQETRSRR